MRTSAGLSGDIVLYSSLSYCQDDYSQGKYISERIIRDLLNVKGSVSKRATVLEELILTT